MSAPRAPESVRDGTALLLAQNKTEWTCLAQLLAAVTNLYRDVPKAALDDAPPLIPHWLAVHVSLGFPPAQHLQRAGCLLGLLAQHPHRFLMQRKTSEVVTVVRTHVWSTGTVFNRTLHADNGEVVEPPPPLSRRRMWVNVVPRR